MSRGLTADAITAVESRTGYRVYRLVDLEFDSVVRDDGTGKPDTLVEWTATPFNAFVVVETSFDGANWSKCTNGGNVPNLAIGDTTSGRRLFCRQTFLREVGQLKNIDPVLKSLTITIKYGDGAPARTITRTEPTDAAWDTGLGDGTTPTADGDVRPHATEALYVNAGGYLKIADTLAHSSVANSYNSALHLSRGTLTEQTIDAAELFLSTEESAFSIEFMCRADEAEGSGAWLSWWPNRGIDIEHVGSAIVLKVTEHGAGLNPADATQQYYTHELQTDDGVLTPGREQYFAFTYDGSTLAIYVDGQLKKTDLLPNQVFETKDGLVYWVQDSATLRELRFWRRALTAGEISAHYAARELTLTNAQVTSEIANERLVGYWRMDSADAAGSGSRYVVTDQSGNGNNLLAIGATVARLTDVGPVVIDGNKLPVRYSAPLALDMPGEAIYITNAPMDVVANGHTYLGVGGLGQFDSIDEGSAANPAGARMALSGLTAAYISDALESQYVDRPCRSSIAFFTAETGQLVSDPVSVFDGRMDKMDIELGSTAAIQLSAESLLVDFDRLRTRYWSDLDQRSRYPQDSAFAFIATVKDRVIWWPGKSDF